MQTRTLTVLNKLGIHARPAALLTRTAGLFDCSVTIEKDGRKIDAKSILSVMTMAAKCGDAITVITDGRNDVEAIEAITALFQTRFGEDE